MTDTDVAALETAQLYSEELGIDLSENTDDACFRWFLASVLFGGRISETIAEHTFRSFTSHGLTTPRTILDAGWDYLVNPVMREGGYVRYDESRSRQILGHCQKILDDYDGRITRLDEVAESPADLEKRLTDFKGIGPVTANIFLRELRPYWTMADPEPLEAVRDTARELGVDISGYDRKSITFCRVEAGLTRKRHGHAHTS